MSHSASVGGIYFADFFLAFVSGVSAQNLNNLLLLLLLVTLVNIVELSFVKLRGKCCSERFS